MVKHYQSVLILGSSVDRNALADSYPNVLNPEQYSFTVDKVPIQHNVVNDPARSVSLAVLQHPGVGLNGDLEAPFWKPGWKIKNRSDVQRRPAGTHADQAGKPYKWKYKPTSKVITYAPHFAQLVFGKAPDLVVVETSLWDLSTWWQLTGHQATPGRLEQWCNKDLPLLLKAVTDAFPETRVVFRTAPTVAPMTFERWTHDDFQALYKCVERRSAGTGEVFEHVGVIDYHDIMDELIVRKSSGENLSLWLEDGYHPRSLPGRLYLNQIFKLIGVPLLEDPPPSWQGRLRAPSDDDEDDL